MKTYLNLLVLATFLFVSYETELNDIDINYKANIDLNIKPPVLNFDATDDDEDIRDGLAAMANGTTVNFTSGVTYDINVDIIIEDKSNITINGNNVTFRYITDGVRFKIKSSSTINVKDLVIDNNNTNAEGGSDSHTGRIIVNNSSSYVTLDNIEMTAQKGRSGTTQAVHQILIEKSDHITVKNCDLEESSGELVHLLASTDCLVDNNDMTGGWSGVGTAGILEGTTEVYGSENTISNNTIYNATTAYITINDQDALVEYNTIKSTANPNNDFGGPGIRFGHNNDGYDHEYAIGAICRNNTISDLLINNNPDGDYEPVAIKVDYTQIDGTFYDNYNNLIIENNTISNCKKGIKVSNQPGQYLTIKENSIQTIDEAIELFSPDGPQQEPQHCLVDNNDLLKSDNQVIKVYNSSLDLKNNDDITLNSNDTWDKAVLIQNMYGTAGTHLNEIKISNNNFNLEDATGIYYNEIHLDGMLIEDNNFYDGNIAIYVGGKNTTIDGNFIASPLSWPIYLTSYSEDVDILGNTVNSYFRSCVYLLSTDNTTLSGNTFDFKAGRTYPWAVWMNTPASNISESFLNNTIINFDNEHN